jgi:hypothetical protein
VRHTWAPRGQPPVLTHPFNWKRTSMAAALCYGVRGGGAQLCFHVQAGNYDTDSLIGVLGELRRFLGGEKGVERVRRTPHLAYSFLRRTGLSVA